MTGYSPDPEKRCRSCQSNETAPRPTQAPYLPGRSTGREVDSPEFTWSLALHRNITLVWCLMSGSKRVLILVTMRWRTSLQRSSISVACIFVNDFSAEYNSSSAASTSSAWARTSASRSRRWATLICEPTSSQTASDLRKATMACSCSSVATATLKCHRFFG